MQFFCFWSETGHPTISPGNLIYTTKLSFTFYVWCLLFQSEIAVTCKHIFSQHVENKTNTHTIWNLQQAVDKLDAKVKKINVKI